jgi:FMN reductase
MEDFTEMTPLTVGSPQQVIDRYAAMRDYYGDYQRQLFLVDHAGLPLKLVLEQIDFLGEDVVPVLRRELQKNRPENVPDAPTQGSASAAPQRQPRRQRHGGIAVPGHRERVRIGGRQVTRTIAVVSAGLSDPSSTRMLADKLVQAVFAALDARGVEREARVFELRDVAHDITNNLLTGFAPKALAEVNDYVAGADALIAVTPIFSTSYSGLFKSWLDVLDREAIEGTPVLLGATAGTARHSLAIDYAMRPLFTYLHAEPISTGVFAASSDWGAEADRVAPLQKRIDRAASELADRLAGSAAVEKTDPFAPESYLAGGSSFEDLLTNLPPRG